VTAPERAGREGDQALPSAGRESVFAVLRRDLDERRREIDAREGVGIKRYGFTLKTFNRRDVYRDLGEELFDARAYLKQAELEHLATVEALRVLARHVSGEDVDQRALKAALELGLMLEELHHQGG
jgi:hypothetical protein